MAGPAATRPPRQRRREITRRAILDTALRLIARRGVRDLSLREIARQIDYSPAALYEYFDGKDAIIRALSQEGDALLLARLGQVSADLPPDRRLVELGLAYIDFGRAHPEHFRLMFAELPTRRMGLGDRVRPGSPFHLVVQAVKEAIELGLIRRHDGEGPNEIAYALWALAHGATVLQLTKLKGFREDLSSADRRAMESLVRGFMGR